MTIDWFTMAAQIVNFLILVLLLRFIFFKRIKKIMNEREKSIKDKIEESESKLSVADQKIEKYDQKLSFWEKEKKQLKNDYEEKLNMEMNEKKQKVLDEIKDKKEQWFNELRNEKISYYNSIKNDIAEEIFQISSQVFKDLADTNVEEKMTDRFIEKLKSLNESMFDGQNNQKIMISSSFTISDQGQEKIRNILFELIDEIKQIDFENTHDAIYGITLNINNYEISWSINEYLEGLKNNVFALIDQGT